MLPAAPVGAGSTHGWGHPEPRGGTPTPAAAEGTGGERGPRCALGWEVPAPGCTPRGGDPPGAHLPPPGPCPPT